MEKTQKSFDFQKSQLPEQSYLEAVFPDMKPDDEESDEMSAKIPMATLVLAKMSVIIQGKYGFGFNSVIGKEAVVQAVLGRLDHHYRDTNVRPM